MENGYFQIKGYISNLTFHTLQKYLSEMPHIFSKEEAFNKKIYKRIFFCLKYFLNDQFVNIIMQFED